MPFHLAALASIFLFFGLKLVVLYDFNSGALKSTFHDDYSYLQQINLLISQKTESHFTELLRSAFYLDLEYKIYHFAEFYILIIFKLLFGNTSYNWFHFFLKPLLNVVAVLMTLAFFRKRSINEMGFFTSFLLTVLLFTTLRFNLLDDYLSAHFPSAFWKSVFFQNYYFPGPLSYHVSYKVTIALIFILPVITFFYNVGSKWLDLLIYTIIATIFSVGLLPYTLVLTGIRLGQDLISKKYLTRLIWIGCGVLLVAGFFVTGDPMAMAPKYFFTSFFNGFNLIFENYYWHLFYISILILVGVKPLRYKILAVVLSSFPLIFLSPYILFKIYSIVILGFLGYSLYRRQVFFQGYFFSFFIPALLGLYFLRAFLPGLANVDQIFSNLLFPVLLLSFLEFLVLLKLSVGIKTNTALIGFLFFLNIPAIKYDNETPLHIEKIPLQFFNEPVFKQKWVNILSISKYTSFPAIDESQLGNGILDKKDNVAITMGGFEQFTPKELQAISESKFAKSLHRIPYFEFLRSGNSNLMDFIKLRQVKIVLVQDDSDFAPYASELKSYIKSQYYEPEEKYWIYILN